MKYLKLFEVRTGDTVLPGKYSVRYIVFNSLNIYNNTQYTIFKLSNFDVDTMMVNLTKLYTYSKNGNLKKITPPDNLCEFTYFKFKKNILYESTNLQTCLNKLPLISAQNKYNL